MPADVTPQERARDATSPISDSELTAFRYMGLVATKENPDDSLAYNFLRLIAEVDHQRARARDAAQTLIAEIGADGPENIESVARRAADRLRAAPHEGPRGQGCTCGGAVAAIDSAYKQGVENGRALREGGGA